MQRLAGKVALVTGGARGIGLAIARRFAREGAAAVILADRDEAEAERVAPENPAFHPCSLDVTKDEDWAKAVDRTVARTAVSTCWSTMRGSRSSARSNPSPWRIGIGSRRSMWTVPSWAAATPCGR